MKYIVLSALLTFSSAVFANQSDYSWICLGATPKDTQALRKINFKQGQFLKEIDILLVNQSKYCGGMHIAIYSGVCQFDGLTLKIGLDVAATLSKPRGKKINLECYQDLDVGPIGVIGGSN